MTNEQLIERAIEQLKDNKVRKDMLESPRVRPAAVVYFKIHPNQNVMLVLDKESGEQITAYFGSDPFLKEYMSHCLDTENAPQSPL